MFKIIVLTFGRFIRVLSTVAVLLFLGATARPAYAIQCGDQITVDTKLYADLGPCPGDGLLVTEVIGQLNNVTLDLNGHTITGAGTGTGVRVGGGFYANAIIKGAGTIKNFATGISVDGAMWGNSLIYNLVLTGNQTGIFLYQTSGGWGQQRVLNNTITGTNRQTIGVDARRGMNIYVYQNTIRGHSVGVVTETEIEAVIDQNLITLNQTGILERVELYNCSVIRGNQVILNLGDGIADQYFVYPAAPLIAPGTNYTSCQGSRDSTIDGNTVSFNGGSGIVVETGEDHAQLIQNNMVFWNKRNGISITGGGEPGGAVQVMGNDLSRNGTDLMWDGVAINVCGLQNIYDTSSPQTLPACQ